MELKLPWGVIAAYLTTFSALGLAFVLAVTGGIDLG